jgi:uncharacterized damage-inducible protein DinB
MEGYSMSGILSELYAHQAWADAEHWRVLETIPAALDDAAVRRRLHHIHLVQRAYLAIVTGERFRPKPLEKFASIAEVKEEARQCHGAADAFMRSLTPQAAAASIIIPWFRESPLQVSVEEALVQAAMHSHYHRGQNATRMRELGGEPPLTDFVAWLLKGKPAPAWEG